MDVIIEKMDNKNFENPWWSTSSYQKYDDIFKIHNISFLFKKINQYLYRHLVDDRKKLDFDLF